MRLQVLALAAAIALAAGCNKGSDQAKPAASTDKAPSQSQVNTPTNTPTPSASTGQSASPEEKKGGANPIQGQVDPKNAEQQRDFQQKGDGAGPKGPDTEPKQGK